jgi:hypothetical protein
LSSAADGDLDLVLLMQQSWQLPMGTRQLPLLPAALAQWPLLGNWCHLQQGMKGGGKDWLL